MFNNPFHMVIKNSFNVMFGIEKKQTVKYILLIFLLGGINNLIAQNILYTTDFGTIANVNPAGWWFTGVDMNISTNTSSSGYPGASGNAYLGEGNSVAFINTSGTSIPSSQIGTSSASFSLNTVGYSTVALSFGMRKSSAGYNSNATYSLDWSSNGVTYFPISYTEAVAGSWGLASGAGLTLPPGAGNQANLYFRWTFVRTGTASNFKIDDLSVTGYSTTNNPPTIVMNVAATTNYLDGGVGADPGSPFSLSGVINDPTDPANNLGVDFIINDLIVPVPNLTVTANSSNTVVVPNANVSLTGSGANRNVKINPVSVGYSNIILTVNNGSSTASYTLNYASSAASNSPSNTIWHTGMSDASDAIALDDNFYITADDELDIINVYSRSVSGLPLTSFSYSTLIALPDVVKPETDIEAAITSPTTPNKKYFLGSMSTGGNSFTIRLSRDCLFSTIVSGTGSLTTFSIQGYYNTLRPKLVSWGDSHGYNFSASAASGVDSKSTSGYAVEGMVFGPDNTTLFIGFRAPMVPVASRTNAVIAPIANFEAWFNNGSPIGNPTIGAPIELNLNGRAIRDLIRMSNGTYIIIAGNSGSSPITSAVYKWTGNANDVPIFVANGQAILNMEGVMEVNVGGQLSMTQLQIISDMGGSIIYNDGNEAKDLGDLSLRKFRVDNLTGLDLCLITTSATPVVSVNGITLTSTSGSSYQWYLNNVAITGATLQTYVTNQNGNYYVAVTNSLGCVANATLVTINEVGLLNYSINDNNIIVFPNPFTESTSLQLTLSSNSKVTIEIYTLLGQKINTVADSNYEPGNHKFTFGVKNSGYSAGMYFVKTNINGKTYVTRIIENE